MTEQTKRRPPWAVSDAKQIAAGIRRESNLNIRERALLDLDDEIARLLDLLAEKDATIQRVREALVSSPFHIWNEDIQRALAALDGQEG